MEKKKWTYRSDPKLNGAYGETDFDKKEIRVNKKAHRSKSLKRISPNKDGSENLLKTIYHEEMHKRHPRMHEKTVRKLEKNAEKLSKRQKAKFYSRINTNAKV